MRRLACCLALLALLGLAACAGRPPVAGANAFADTDAAAVDALMARAQVPGLALAVIRDGQVVRREAHGWADRDKGEPLRSDTIMYAASLTKAAFAYLVMQLVDEGVIALDAPLPQQLKKPLPEYADFADLAADERWRAVTPRMLLSHSSGLLNWRWINEDRKLDFKFPPGSRYVYSGEGLQILQLIVEERSGQPLQALMQQRVFDRFGMKNSSMAWREDFAAHAAQGYDKQGQAQGFHRSRRARAAGSMNTTLDDYAAFLAGVLRGEGLSPAAQRQMLGPQIAIVSPQQFPSQWPGETRVNDGIALAGGLGWVVYRSPQGPAFFKEGSDESTNNFALGFPGRRDGLLMLANSANADQIFYPLAEALMGPTCLPWFWMGYIPYDRPELRKPVAREAPLGPGAGCPAPAR